MLGWIGNVFIVAGLYGLGNKSRNAFIYSIAGEILWTINATIRHDWALASICVVFGLMAVRGFFMWGTNYDS